MFKKEFQQYEELRKDAFLFDLALLNSCVIVTKDKKLIERLKRYTKILKPIEEVHILLLESNDVTPFSTLISHILGNTNIQLDNLKILKV